MNEDVDLTSEEIIALIENSGLTQSEFAKKIGTDSATVRRMQRGLLPWKKKVKMALIAYARTVNKPRSSNSKKSKRVMKSDANGIPSMNMHTMRKLVKDSGLTKTEFAARVGASLATADNWLTGRNVPSLPKLEKLHALWREVYAENMLDLSDLSPLEEKAVTESPVELPEELPAEEQSDVESPVEDATQTNGVQRRARRLVAVTKVTEITTKFFQMHQIEYNRRYSNDILAVLEEETSLDRPTLRLIVSTWAVLMKERFPTLEEALSVVSGIDS